MCECVTVTCKGISKTYAKGTRLESIAKDFQTEFAHTIILARVNQKLCELFKTIETDCVVDFITVAEKIGHQAYTRTATMILTKAVGDILGIKERNHVVVEHSLSKGFYCRIKHTLIDDDLLTRIETRMKEIVRENLSIHKRTISTDEAIRIFTDAGMEDKVKLFRYRSASQVHIYRLDDFEDYYYGYMAPSTGYVPLFKLYAYQDGFVMQMPEMGKPGVLPAFEPSHKLFNVLDEATKWAEMLDISTVGDLNDLISKGQFNELMLVAEALQEKRIADIAEQIVKNNRRVVLIAGPSSSGKTTFSHRLSIQLRAHGLKPHPIPVDDYFVERERTPLDEFGKPNYECLGALDVDLFNEHMSALLRGERVELPNFNFITGKREYKGNFKQIGPDDILVIEGIHGLNDALTYSIHKDSKFKVYISALTQLNVDEHNRIPTTDGRLIRRMVRDNAKRGTNPAQTISMWDSVRRGEEENIFPFQEEADAMFNSALIYELAILKQYAAPLLYGITKDMPEYDEAKRLLKFLDYFLGVSSENVPNNSILREFIGNGCFKV